MSKSLGNLVFVSKLINEGVEPTAIRWALMDHHYSHDLMWSEEIMKSASHEVERLRINLSRMEVAPTGSVIENIIKALADNLDTKRVLSELDRWMFATESGEEGGEAGELARALDSLLGFSL
jgi:L-cysteine:1D-myo-inositol 2-amino-2-deoxy-alpha-D-glucopyranoside ligase